VRARARLLATSAVLATVVLSGTAFGGTAERLPALAPGAPDGLTRALAQGKVNEAEYALERATALFAPREVSRRFGGLRQTDPHGATLVLRDLAIRLGQLDPAERAAAKAILARPDDGAADPGEHGYSVPAAAPVCSEHVCAHWVSTTRDAPPAVDVDANGVPDQVDATLRVLEEVWQKEVVEYGYRPPKPDGGSPNDGSDDRIDVYLADLGDDSIYGYCTTDDPTAAEGPNGPWDVSAYCALDNDYDPSQFVGAASGDAALQVTAAHEFFHAVQFAYDFLEDAWALEGTAVWMEDEVYDDVNDAYQYLDKSALSRPRIPLDLALEAGSPLGGFQYGSFVFWRFLSESFGGPEVIRRIWELADGSPAGVDQYSWQAVDTALRERGARARAAFARFGAVNAHPERFYEEGSSYPATPISVRRALSPAQPRAAGSPRLDHLTTWYGLFRPAPTAGPAARLRLRLDLPARTRGAEATVIVISATGEPRHVPIALDARGDATRTIPFAPAAVTAVELVLSNASGRFRCWERMPLACQGSPRDDGQTFRYEAQLIAG
jgi:hypothetical protein